MIRSLIKYVVDWTIWLQWLFVRPATDTTSASAASDAKKKILILRKDGLGDCIIFLSTLKAYRERYKDADIHLVLPMVCASLDPLFAAADKIIWFDHGKFRKSYAYRRKFLLGLAREGYAEALYPVFTREYICDWMIALTRAVRCVGFERNHTMDYRSNDSMYTETVAIPEQVISELDRDIIFAKQACRTPVYVTFPTITRQDLQSADIRAREIIEQTFPGDRSGKPYAVIFPGAGQPYRIWPAERFAAIGNMLADRGYIPLLCGAPGDAALADAIINASGRPMDWANITGKTNIITLARILCDAALYFGSDTGALHVAVAVGTPAVAIVGSGGLRRFFPYGDPTKNRAVYDPKYPDQKGSWKDAEKLPPGSIHPSITSITVDMAAKEVENMLEHIRPSQVEQPAEQPEAQQISTI